ncbi:MAG: hypothetical protein QM647_18395 [Asticcacaulis sp.]|uniref:hypothetical protein n=1 Tax=Asticcacaulis sp. TaxID=1872648 RepID=UPI0039E25EC5
MVRQSRYPVRLYVDLTEVQAQRISDLRAEHGCASDSETIRELLTALFDLLDKDPQKGS